MKIKKDFLEEAKNKILSDIRDISQNAKKMLKYVETKESTYTSEVLTKCFLWKEGGSQRNNVAKMMVELKGIEVTESTAKGKYKARLKQRITELMGNHGATS